MSQQRGEEQWAAAVIAAALDGATVDQYDDGSQPGMYDLDVTYQDGRRAAVEVTAAADAASIELWNIVNGKPGRWIEPSFRGGWMVALEPTARAKRIRSELPGFLRRLEERSVPEVRVEGWRRNVSPLEVEAKSLGIADAHQGGSDYPGSIYLTIQEPDERVGHIIDVTGSDVPTWTGSFLAATKQADVLAKLARSGLEERHAFILLPGFTTAPRGVVDMLMIEDDSTPDGAPSLPPEVTHVWLVSLWNLGRGLRWSPDQGWQRFDKA